MGNKNILIVFGTRPEAIKMAPLIIELRNHLPLEYKVIFCSTGQHREMLDQVLEIFGLEPDYDLNIMQKGQDLFDVTIKVLQGMKEVLSIEQPDLVLIHGDTTTSVAAALASYYKQIPVGHIEAGLRTNNIYSPWPEEINRQISGRISTFHFTPTLQSRKNLIKENVCKENIFITGNTVIDSLYIVLNKINSNINIRLQIEKTIFESGYDLKRIESGRRLVLITGHRRENFGEGFLNICKAIKYLAEKYTDVDFLYPMHLNPNVRKPIESVFGELVKTNTYFNNIFFIEPCEYLQFVYLMNVSYLLLTDSGGVQEEAPSLGKPVIVMRDTTERPEALEAGTIKLVGTNYNEIIKNVSLLLDDINEYSKMSSAENPYGDGKACNRILNHIIGILNN